MKAYTLKIKENTNEYHLFEGEMSTNSCTSKNQSICEKMKKNESSGNVFQCKDENEARTRCAKLGREVCGTCVSHLYTTY